MEVLSYSIFEKFKMALRCPIYTPANQSNNRPTTRPWVTFGHLPWQYTLYNTITHIPDFDDGWPWMTLVDLGPSSVISHSSKHIFSWLCPWATLDDLGWPWVIFRDITLFKIHIFLTLTLSDLGWPWVTFGSVTSHLSNYTFYWTSRKWVYADEVNSLRSGRGLLKDGRALCIRSKNLMRGFASQGQKVMSEKS